MLAAGGADSDTNLTIFDAESLEVLSQHAAEGLSSPTSFSPDGSLLTDGGRIIEVATGRIVHRFLPEGVGVLTRGVYSRDGTIIATSVGPEDDAPAPDRSG